jgi:HTH-type transcriptional regulator/antitoxin HigA
LQLQEYETLKSGSVEILKASTLQELPTILIKARIVKGWSQRQLADTIGVKEQQIQRYEAEEYASANLRRLEDVAIALGLNITEIGEFRTALQQPSQIKGGLAWDQFPIKEMYRRQWFEGFTGSLEDAIANAEELVSDFVMKSLDKPIQTASRQRVRAGGSVDWYALLAWQCRIIALANKMKKEMKKEYKQKVITNEWLNKLVHMSMKEDGPQIVIEYLQNSGISLIIEPHLPQTHLDGAAFLLSNDSSIIGMTLRYDRLDNFWFVLLHELVHIMKHLHRGDIESIFDDLEEEAKDIEREADEEAGKILVPEDKWETSLARYVQSKESIIDFAKEQNINPAIVAGKIRREAKNYIILNDMVGNGEVRKLFPNVNFAY